MFGSIKNTSYFRDIQMQPIITQCLKNTLLSEQNSVQYSWEHHLISHFINDEFTFMLILTTFFRNFYDSVSINFILK